jgi:hypothetical protein
MSERPSELPVLGQAAVRDAHDVDAAERDLGALGRRRAGEAAGVGAVANPAGGEHVAVDERADLDGEGQLRERRAAHPDHLDARLRPVNVLRLAGLRARLVDDEVGGEDLLRH